MSFTESAYTPDRSTTERAPDGAEGAAEEGVAVTPRTVLRDVSAVKYSPERAITI
jgi:hypothetical protein